MMASRVWVINCDTCYTTCSDLEKRYSQRGWSPFKIECQRCRSKVNNYSNVPMRPR